MNKLDSDQYRLEVYAHLEESIDAIQHYDSLQCFLRKVNITLLMGTFAAIGFVLSIDSKSLPMNPVILSMGICFFSIIMNLVVSTIDLIFIERLLMSAFLDALRLEKENSWLFPIHSRMLNSAQEHHGSLSKKIKFYVGYNKDLILVIFACLSFTLGYSNWKWIFFVLLPIATILVILYEKSFQAIAWRSERRLYKKFEN